MIKRPFGDIFSNGRFFYYERPQTEQKNIILLRTGQMKGRFLRGEGQISSPSRYLSTVSYMIEIIEGEPIQGSIQVLSGAGGLSLYEHDEMVVLYLGDGRCLTIVVQTPIDLTNDSWQILGSGSIRQT